MADDSNNKKAVKKQKVVKAKTVPDPKKSPELKKPAKKRKSKKPKKENYVNAKEFLQNIKDYYGSDGEVIGRGLGESIFINRIKKEKRQRDVIEEYKETMYDSLIGDQAGDNIYIKNTTNSDDPDADSHY